MAGKKIVLWFEYALFALGVGLLVYVATSCAVVAVYQRYLERIFLGDPPPPTKARVAIPPKDGSPVGRLEIPRLNVSVMVLEGAEDRTLRMERDMYPVPVYHWPV